MDPCDKLIACAQVFQNESILQKNQEIHALKTKLRRDEDPAVIYESLEEYNNLYNKMKEYISTNINEYLTNKYELINPDTFSSKIPLENKDINNLIEIIRDGIYIFTKNDYKSWVNEFSKTIKIVLIGYRECISRRRRPLTRSYIYNCFHRNIIDFIITFITIEESSISNMGYFKCEGCSSTTRIEYFISGKCDLCYRK